MLTKAETMKSVNKKFPESLVLQEPIKTPDGRGGFKTTWKDREKIYFEFRKTSVSTGVVAGAVASDMTQDLGTRYRTDVKKGWRAVYGPRRFDVLHTYSFGHETTIMVCREVVV